MTLTPSHTTSDSVNYVGEMIESLPPVSIHALDPCLPCRPVVTGWSPIPTPESLTMQQLDSTTERTMVSPTDFSRVGQAILPNC